MNYTEARKYIENTGSAGIIPGTDVISELLGRMGDPQKRLKVIHVAGTNGKGSVCTYLERALSECGLKTGRYSSPSVFRYLERIRLSEQDITEEDYALAVSEVKRCAGEMKTPPTGFEAETAAAFRYFDYKKADVIIVECGMGGRDDATNVFDSPLASVFTSISMDHMSFLGDDPEEIALNKAGIMRKDTPVIISHMPPVSCKNTLYFPDKVLQNEGITLGCEVFPAKDLIPEGFKNPLPGSYQTDNLNTALTVLEVLEERLKKLFPSAEISHDIFMKGIEKASWPGRYEKISHDPVIIRDGAHNPGAALALRDAILNDVTLPEDRRIRLVMGVFRDKDYSEVLEIMLPIADTFTSIDLPDKNRRLPKEQLADIARSIAKGTGVSSIRTADSLKEALEVPDRSSRDVFIVFGSLSLMQMFQEIQF